MSNFGGQQQRRNGIRKEAGGSGGERNLLAWPGTLCLCAKCSDKSDCHFCIFAATDDDFSFSLAAAEAGFRCVYKQLGK